MSQDQNSRIQLVWHNSSLAIDAIYLILYLIDLSLDLLSRHIVFIHNGFLLQLD